MDLLRETAPFLVGMFVPPIFMLAIRPHWSGQIKFLAIFLPALVLGFCTSAIAGELTGGVPDGIISVIIDTSLVFTGSQLAYRLLWKQALETRLQGKAVSRIERVPE